MLGLIDTTLREGAQAPVRYLSTGHKIEVIEALARIGMAEIELGHAVAELSYGPEPLAELMDAAAEADPQMRRAIWCRARPEDIETAAEFGPDVVSFALPVSDRHLASRLGRDRGWALDQVTELTDIARSCGVSYLSIGLEDATRADVGFLRDVAAAADWAGVDRLRIADTVGIGPPELISALVGQVAAVYSERSASTCTTISGWQPRARSLLCRLEPIGPTSACSAWANGPASPVSRRSAAGSPCRQRAVTSCPPFATSLTGSADGSIARCLRRHH